jgi:hypothetical protein
MRARAVIYNLKKKREKWAKLIFSTSIVFVLTLILIKHVPAAITPENDGYLNCMTKCYNGFQVNFSCVDECGASSGLNNTKFENCVFQYKSYKLPMFIESYKSVCKIGDNENYSAYLMALRCKEGIFLPGNHTGKTCTITNDETFKVTYDFVKRQAIYSFGKVFPAFIFENFVIQKREELDAKGVDWGNFELRIYEYNTDKRGNGNGDGGDGGNGENGKKGGEKGGKGGKGANFSAPAEAGGGGGYGTNGGGRILLIAKNFILENATINADGEWGITGLAANCNYECGDRSRSAGLGGMGGQGGGGGGHVFIVAEDFYNDGRISARGGIGGAGGTENGGYGGGGGGGGGDGGMIVILATNTINNGKLDASGGYGGCVKFENGAYINAKWSTSGGKCDDHPCSFYGLSGSGDKSFKDNFNDIIKDCKGCEENVSSFLEDQLLNAKQNGKDTTAMSDDPDTDIDYWPLWFSRFKIANLFLHFLNINCSKGSSGKEGLEGEPGKDGADGIVVSSGRGCLFFKSSNEIKLFDPGEQWCDDIPGVVQGQNHLGSSHWLFTCKEGTVEELVNSNREEICWKQDSGWEWLENDWLLCLEGVGDSRICQDNMPKYPPYGNCSYGNNLTTVSVSFSSSNYYQGFAETAIQQVQNLNGWLEKCRHMGDCGNTAHFISSVGTTPGYSFIVFPPVNGKASALFRCERVISNYDNTGEKCNLCNPGNIEKYFGYHRDCSRYNCESLGSNCVWDEEKKVCSAQYNYSLPKMQSIEFRDNYGLCSAQSDLDKKEINITCKTANFCIHPNSISEMNYSFDRDVICRMALYNAAPPPSSDLSGEWVNMITASDSDFFRNLHGWHIPPPLFTVPSDVSDKLDVKAYLLCKDRFNNNNIYTINFCISKTDVNPPLIETSLHDGDEVRQGTNQLKIFVNEPIDTCSWSTNDGQGGSLELSNFAYNTAGWLESQISFSMQLRNLEMTIQCNDTSGNANSITLTFKPLVYQLNVLLTAPEHVVDCKKPKINLDIAIGSDAGPQTATCNIYRNGTLVETVSGNSQYSVAIELENGMNVINVTCTNPQLVSASNTTTVTALISPQIGFKKFYLEGESLKIETDSVATCYKLDACPTEGMIPNPLDLIKSNLIDPFSKNTQLHTLQVPFDGSRHAQFCIICRNNCGNITSQMIHVIK